MKSLKIIWEENKHDRFGLSLNVDVCSPERVELISPIDVDGMECATAEELFAFAQGLRLVAEEVHDHAMQELREEADDLLEQNSYLGRAKKEDADESLSEPTPVRHIPRVAAAGTEEVAR